MLLGYLQLLQVAVIYVMVAPIWHSIELDAVGELHGGLAAGELSLRLLGFTMAGALLGMFEAV